MLLHGNKGPKKIEINVNEVIFLLNAFLAILPLIIRSLSSSSRTLVITHGTFHLSLIYFTTKVTQDLQQMWTKCQLIMSCLILTNCKAAVWRTVSRLFTVVQGEGMDWLDLASGQDAMNGR